MIIKSFAGVASTEQLLATHGKESTGERQSHSHLDREAAILANMR